MVNPSTSGSAQVACAAAIKTKNDRENRKRGYEVQIDKPYPGGKMQSTRGYVQSNDQHHSQVGVVEAPNNRKGGCQQLHFIQSLLS